ncbi:MAG: hypothetical protein K0R14_1981 [Burkholderiales bacterium]|jgi:hypothetical protein|nr:hypothetical protein [Burkholderiales bacterium]
MKSFKYLYILSTALFLSLSFFAEIANANPQYVYATVSKYLKKNRQYCQIEINLWWRDTPVLNSIFGRPSEVSKLSFMNGTNAISNEVWSIKKDTVSDDKWIINAYGFDQETVTGKVISTENNDSYYIKAKDSLENYRTLLHQGYVEAPVPIDEDEYPNTSDTAGVKRNTCSIS